MAGLTREGLGQRAGVSVGYVDRLVELGILAPAEGATPFSAGDVRTARFVHGLEEGGVPAEAVAAAIRSGDLSFAFFHAPYWDRFSVLSSTTYRELSAETGLSLEILQTIRESVGSARPEPDDHVREDELDAVALVRAVMAAGADPVAMERQVRAWGDNLRRIAEAESAFYNSQIQIPLLRSGLTHSEMLNAGGDISATIAPLLDPALLSMYHAQSEHTWLAGVVEAVEATLERAGLHKATANSRRCASSTSRVHPAHRGARGRGSRRGVRHPRGADPTTLARTWRPPGQVAR